MHTYLSGRQSPKLPMLNINKIYRTEIFLFICAGTAGFVIDYLAVLLCVQSLFLSPYVARVFSFIAAVLTTYTINKRITFSARIKEGSKTPGLLSYTGTMLLGLCINYAVYAIIIYVAISIPLQLRLLFAVGMGSLAGMALNFILCRTVLFRKITCCQMPEQKSTVKYTNGQQTFNKPETSQACEKKL